MTPRFEVPPGETVRVCVVDTTSRIGKVPTGALVEPSIFGYTHLDDCPSWSFLIQHELSGKKVLFDLGVPQDWKQMSPTVTIDPKWHVEVVKDTSEILEENGISPEQINSIIWRYYNLDFKVTERVYLTKLLLF